MLDLKVIRAEPEAVRAGLARRGVPAVLEALDAVLELDERRRALQTEVDALRAERNAAAQEIGRLKKAGADATEAMAASARLRDRLGELEGELGELDGALQERLLTVPNVPHPSVPEGKEDEGEVVRTVGAPRDGFQPLDHLELAGGLIDMERGSRTSGSRFAYLLGDLVRLHLAVVSYAVDKLCGKGFTPVMPPVLVREEALYGTGFFPGDREMVYSLDPSRDDLFLVGTSEVSLAALHMDEILDEADLPLRYVGISSCFRREAGAAGKDTRGIFRTHQFDKVEMFSFCLPERSWDEHEYLLSIEEEIQQELGFHYQIVNIPTGDLGDSAAKKYDIEVWLPGQGRFRELTSCSNTTDYQARRLGARYRPSAGGAPRMVHTLNGTAVTSSRTLIALLETHQTADGEVEVPEVLRGFGAPAVIRPAPAR
jgi:seryl-tRNA synthetase